MYIRKNDRHALHANGMADACGDKATHQRGTDCPTVQQLRQTQLAALMLAINDSHHFMKLESARNAGLTLALQSMCSCWRV